MYRILVVDDEPDLRFLMRAILERAGHDVVEAIHGGAALQAIRSSVFDLVITDMTMPVMGGAELIARLRSDPATTAIPIVAATGDSQLAAAADVILTKPYPVKRLIEVVNSLLAMKEMQP